MRFVDGWRYEVGDGVRFEVYDEGDDLLVVSDEAFDYDGTYTSFIYYKGESGLYAGEHVGASYEYLRGLKLADDKIARFALYRYLLRCASFEREDAADIFEEWADEVRRGE